MAMDTVELLGELSDQFGISGFEGEIRDWIYANVKDRVDDIQIDVLGNLMTTINPGRDFVMMVDAHMDEIGDAGAIHVTGKGVLTGIDSVPCRYIHSPSSVLDLQDFEHTVSLVIEFICRAREIRNYQS